MLNGKYQRKVKNGNFFRQKFFFLDFGQKLKNQRHIIIVEKSEFSESGVGFAICCQTEPSGEENGIFGAFFGQKWLFWRLGPPLNNFFLRFFDGQQQAQVQLPFYHFGFFRPFLADFYVFVISAPNPKTNTTSLQWNNLNSHNLESDLQQVAKRSPQDGKTAFFGHFLAKNGSFCHGAQL